jgi:UDP-N-acetyl-D-glucosamine dehydrogenase
MPRHVVGLVTDALNERAKAVRGSRVLVVGVAYKGGIDDLRESPALDIIALLEQRGAAVSWYDPHVKELPGDLHAQRLGDWQSEALAEFDAAVIVTAHPQVDHGLLLASGMPVIDTRNALKGFAAEHLITL